MELLIQMAVALVVTIILEASIAWIFLRRKDVTGSSVLMNIFTNPLLNALLAAVGYYAPGKESVYWTAVFLGEILVWLVETLLLDWLTGLSFRRAAVWSLILNGTSFLFGKLLELCGIW